MSLPRFSVNNHVLVNMMMIVILIGGTIFAFTLTREMFPESRPDKIMITAVYPGVQPAEIERAVAIKVEESVRDVDGVDKVDTVVSEGIVSVVLTLLNEIDDVDVVLQEVKNEVDAIQDLPDDLEQITVFKFEPKLPVIAAAIYGDGDEGTLKEAARELRDELLLLEGVSDVELNGVRDDEISVEIRPERLLEYNVTFDEIAQAIRDTNLDVSGGDLKGARARISVRTLGEELQGEDLNDIVIRAESDGRKILLEDVAIVKDDFVDTDLESFFNGKPSADCIVYKTASQDAIQIATVIKAFVAGKQGVKFDPHGFEEAYNAPWYKKPVALLGAFFSQATTKALSVLGGRPDPMKVYEASLNKPFDHNFEVALHTDLSRFIEGRLDLMTRNGASGLLLVVISLICFLNWRVALWAAIGLPVSFLGTFILMWVFGVTFNLLSMFGLIIVLGIIVDDAIVIGENIFRHVEEGEEPKEAAVNGAEEVMWPVTIAIATTIAAFAPLLFIQGQIGDFMGQLPIVVLAALSVSLIEALLILPAHLAHLPSAREREQRAALQSESAGMLRRFGMRIDRFRERLVQGTVVAWYVRFLRVALKWRYVTLCTATGLLMITFGLVAGGIVERVFIQKMDSESIICKLELPVGTPAEQVKETMGSITELAVSQPEVVNVQSFVARQIDIGGAGGTESVGDQSHLGQLIIELKAADERELLNQRSSTEILTVLRKASQSLPGVNSVVWEELNGGPGGRAIEIKITGSDFAEIVAVSQELKSKLDTYDGVFDLDDNYDKGKREVQLRLRDTARSTGITTAMLGREVRAATYGREARRLTRNREDVRIMVRYPERYRSNIYQLESMWIPTHPNMPNQRGWVPLSEVAELTESESYTTIHRSQQQRSITVFGEIDDDITPAAEVINDVRATFGPKLAAEHPDVKMEFLGSFEQRMKSFGSLRVAFPVALVMIYMLLAGLFRSYLQPVVVMSAIPFGVMGAIVGHLITDNPITILSQIGMVALTGILVNDSLVLVDFINKRIRRGMAPFEASIEGAKLRLRAILLTTLTTAAGLMPLMFETSFQAKFLIPMAVTLTFGLIFATALTLIIVPSLNLVYFDFVGLFQRRQNRQETKMLIAGGGAAPASPAAPEESLNGL